MKYAVKASIHLVCLKTNLIIFQTLCLQKYALILSFVQYIIIRILLQVQQTTVCNMSQKSCDQFFSTANIYLCIIVI